MKIYLLGLLLLLGVAKSYGCCANNSYRLFPIGELNNNVMFLEVKIFKNCKEFSGKKEELAKSEIWVTGVFNLVESKNDTIYLLESLDSMHISDCLMEDDLTYKKSEFQKVLGKNYNLAISKVESKNSKLAKPISIEFNDTLHTKLIDDDQNYRIQYKDLLDIDLDSLPIDLSDMTNVREVREYESENYKITIVRLSNRPISAGAIKYNKKRFKVIETAYWKEKINFHSGQKDFIYIEKKD